MVVRTDTEMPENYYYNAAHLAHAHELSVGFRGFVDEIAFTTEAGVGNGQRRGDNEKGGQRKFHPCGGFGSVRFALI